MIMNVYEIDFFFSLSFQMHSCILKDWNIWITIINKNTNLLKVLIYLLGITSYFYFIFIKFLLYISSIGMTKGTHLAHLVMGRV